MNTEFWCGKLLERANPKSTEDVGSLESRMWWKQMNCLRSRSTVDLGVTVFILSVVRSVSVS
jgi:hypothetical protein